MALTAGYDVGGAHLKVALAQDGRTIAVRQIACPLWRGLEHLDAAFADAADLTGRADTHAVTMTGELCEIFPDRATGVRVIIDRVKTLLPNFKVWMGMRGMGSPDFAETDPMSVASTNFLASAALVARRTPDALLIDMGSTTTDIIAVREGKIAARGLTDGDRLRSGELVYTGLTRSDVTSTAHQGVFRGRAQRLAAGGFATMADVRRILGELPDDVDQHPTADGRGKSLEESIARFARCFGWDAADASLDEWREAAESIAVQQGRDIGSAVAELLIGAELPPAAPIIAAGIGADVITALAHDLEREVTRFGDLADATDDCRDWATRCAPAVAVASLAGSD
jgi:probable H4MPT-linked C1 transfer pathway protein